VFFENGNGYTFTGEKKAEHDSGGSATDDATSGAGKSPSALRHPATVAGVSVWVNAETTCL
jgi:hypothetical protein